MRKLILLGAAVLLVVGIVPAQQLGFKTIEAAAGYVSMNADWGGGNESMSGFGVLAGSNLGELTKGLYLVPELGYLSTSKSESGVSVTVGDFVINGNVRYVFEAGSSIKPYLGGGIGFNFASVSVDFDDPTLQQFEQSDSEMKFGINLLGGAAFPVSDKIDLGAQVRYVVVSEINHLMLLATFSYALGN